MNVKRALKIAGLFAASVACFCFGTEAFASVASGGIGSVANQVKGNLSGVAQLITAGAYVAGLGFAVGAIVKFKAHKDNPTQIPIGMPIALLFVAAALIFVPSAFKATGTTLFGGSGAVGKVSGFTTF